MQRLGQPFDYVAGLMDLASLDRSMGAEGAADDFAQRLGAVDDEQSAHSERRSNNPSLKRPGIPVAPE